MTDASQRRDQLSEYAAKSLVRVEFYTRSYHVSGDMEVNRWRLVDVLNDRTKPFVLMQNAVHEPLAWKGPGSGARAAGVLQVAKHAIVFAIPHEVPELAAARQQYLSALYAERNLVEATALIPPFEIKGALHLRRLTSARQALEEAAAEFVALTHVQATLAAESRFLVAAELAVLNRPMAEVFVLEAERSIESGHGFRKE